MKMKKDLGSISAVCPMPILMVAAYGPDGKVDVMNAAMGMTCQKDKIALFIHESHKTTQNILATKAFTVALADREHLAAADYFGIVSGNKVPDKFERTGYHAVKSGHVNAPVIEEFPITMECELADVVSNDSMYAIIGRIVNVCADESLIGENGKVDISRTELIAFDQFSSSYIVLGERAGMVALDGKSLK